MNANDFTIAITYRDEVQWQVERWCKDHKIRLNENRRMLTNSSMARLVTEMGLEDGFFRIKGVQKGRHHRNSIDHRAARIPPAPLNVGDLVGDREAYHGMEVGRYRCTYSNPDHTRITEDDER